MQNNTRGRNWLLVVFKGQEEDITKATNETLTQLKKQGENGELNYAYITHDKDIEEDGTPKTLHTHFVLSYANARSFSSIKKAYQGAHIEQISNLGASIQYLTHKNNPNKHQYDFNAIATNNLDWLTRFYNILLQNASEYVDNERELIKDLREGTYKNLFEIIISEKYSMEFLQKRKSIIEALIIGLSQQRKIEMIEREQEETRRRMQETFKDLITPTEKDLQD